MKNILEFLENTPIPKKTALIGEDGCLTFEEIQILARKIGSYIASQKIYKQPIPIIMKKSPETIAAFFGVVYSGNYYIPLDSMLPKPKLEIILNKINPSIIIDENEFKKAAGYQINNKSLKEIRINSIDTDPVYTVFTSGSTGEPKGVVACHRGVIDYIESLCPVLGADCDTVFGNQSPLYLDACLKEIFPTFKYGATTYFIPQGLFSFPIKLIEYITENKINTICWVASALSIVAGLGALKKMPPRTLKTIAFGSEKIPFKHLEEWFNTLPEAKFIHLYGPTEATGMCTYYIVEKPINPLPIGKPMLNREIILIDGEIHIRGSALSLGYFADPEKTAEVFIQNPNTPYRDILYKTGDMGYLNPEGNYVFTSRKDRQIKHMGYRIELNEIESAANAINGILQTCAVYNEEKGKIILYYTSQNVEPKEIRTYLKTALPRYMNPHEINHIESMPSTGGGKIDRVAFMRSLREN